ncbi:hypothetical protein DOX53_19310 [Cronobacter malonaticus]|uniref:Rep protein n=1 Tax=Cronobacter malonaticus TaxID=413503 RepID=A0ABX5JWS1_9ENTR|nr:hypothetical protein [Cronobacter malonaticus]EGT4290533.1 hypothetical protein [Cronobacter malonaticus]EGT4298941.1 hypothetical protein [Cronobacter malonaticus]EGT4315875.1 hypothetical protein [Cronobacter malonaticus]EGT4335696.1 hypothetical protein [Cronobacter malonaticus]
MIARSYHRHGAKAPSTCGSDFVVWQGGKQVNPRELTSVSDRGERAQPGPPRRESPFGLWVRFRGVARRQASESPGAYTSK